MGSGSRNEGWSPSKGSRMTTSRQRQCKEHLEFPANQWEQPFPGPHCCERPRFTERGRLACARRRRLPAGARCSRGSTTRFLGRRPPCSIIIRHRFRSNRTIRRSRTIGRSPFRYARRMVLILTWKMDASSLAVTQDFFIRFPFRASCDMAVTIQMRSSRGKRPCRGQEWSGGDTRGQHFLRQLTARVTSRESCYYSSCKEHEVI